MKKVFFKYEEVRPGHWIIQPIHKEFSDEPITGSYALLACRVSGFTWPNWLRFCRQNGATLYGKNSLYVSAVWSTPNEEFLRQLNERANEISEIFDLKKVKL